MAITENPPRALSIAEVAEASGLRKINFYKERLGRT
jgi:hypothetical protein